MSPDCLSAGVRHVPASIPHVAISATQPNAGLSGNHSAKKVRRLPPRPPSASHTASTVDAFAVAAHCGEQAGGLADEVAQPQDPSGHVQKAGVAVPIAASHDKPGHRSAAASIARARPGNSATGSVERGHQPPSSSVRRAPVASSRSRGVLNHRQGGPRVGTAVTRIGRPGRLGRAGTAAARRHRQEQRHSRGARHPGPHDASRAADPRRMSPAAPSGQRPWSQAVPIG